MFLVPDHLTVDSVFDGKLIVEDPSHIEKLYASISFDGNITYFRDPKDSFVKFPWKKRISNFSRCMFKISDFQTKVKEEKIERFVELFYSLYDGPVFAEFSSSEECILVYVPRNVNKLVLLHLKDQLVMKIFNHTITYWDKSIHYSYYNHSLFFAPQTNLMELYIYYNNALYNPISLAQVYEAITFPIFEESKLIGVASVGRRSGRRLSIVYIRINFEEQATYRWTTEVQNLKCWAFVVRVKRGEKLLNVEAVSVEQIYLDHNDDFVMTRLKNISLSHFLSDELGDFVYYIDIDVDFKSGTTTLFKVKSDLRDQILVVEPEFVEKEVFRPKCFDFGLWRVPLEREYLIEAEG